MESGSKVAKFGFAQLQSILSKTIESTKTEPKSTMRYNCQIEIGYLIKVFSLNLQCPKDALYVLLSWKSLTGTGYIGTFGLQFCKIVIWNCLWICYINVWSLNFDLSISFITCLGKHEVVIQFLEFFSLVAWCMF